MLTTDLLSQNAIKTLIGGTPDKTRSLNDNLTVVDTLQSCFRHSFAQDLYSFIHTSAELSTSSSFVTQLTDCDYATPAELRIDAVFYSPVAEPILLALDTHLVEFIMERFFGGAGKHSYSPKTRKTLSSSEIYMIRIIFTKVMLSLEKARLPLTELSFKLQLPPADLWVNQRISPNETIALLTTQIKLKNIQGNLQILLPVSLLSTLMK